MWLRARSCLVLAVVALVACHKQRRAPAPDSSPAAPPSVDARQPDAAPPAPADGGVSDGGARTAIAPVIEQLEAATGAEQQAALAALDPATLIAMAESPAGCVVPAEASDELERRKLAPHLATRPDVADAALHARALCRVLQDDNPKRLRERLREFLPPLGDIVLAEERCTGVGENRASTTRKLSRKNLKGDELAPPFHPPDCEPPAHGETRCTLQSIGGTEYRVRFSGAGSQGPHITAIETHLLASCSGD